MEIKKEETRREYERRIEKAKRFIALRLTEDIALADIAAEAAFSEFHFHRIFTSFTGETVAQYVRRLRLEMAANRLLHDQSSTLTTIGLECGFNNPSVFSRAFKERFGVTPELYRKGRHAKKRGAASLLHRLLLRRSVDRVRIEKFTPRRMFFMSHVGPYDQSLMPFYRKVERLTRAVRIDGNDGLVGIPADNPHITPSHLCRYELGMPVIEGAEVSAEGEFRIFSPGLTAIYPYEGRPFFIENGFEALYATWLPESGFQPADHPAFLVHHDDHFYSSILRKTNIDICLPIKPL